MFHYIYVYTYIHTYIFIHKYIHLCIYTYMKMQCQRSTPFLGPPVWRGTVPTRRPAPTKREFFIDNLLVRIHFIIEKILVDRPCAMRV